MFELDVLEGTIYLQYQQLLWLKKVSIFRNVWIEYDGVGDLHQNINCFNRWKKSVHMNSISSIEHKYQSNIRI